LLRVAEKGKVCSTVDWEAHKDLARTWRCQYFCTGIQRASRAYLGSCGLR
jgi:hypothetical protein